MSALVQLQCVRDGSKDRVRIISPGYSPYANCQFPRDIRVPGRRYLVPSSDISMANTQGKFFYRVKKGSIQILPDQDQGQGPSMRQEQVFGLDNVDCSICMETVELIIFYPCGHCCSCGTCATKIRACPLCRAPIGSIVTRDQLQ